MRSSPVNRRCTLCSMRVQCACRPSRMKHRRMKLTSNDRWWHSKCVLLPLLASRHRSFSQDHRNRLNDLISKCEELKAKLYEDCLSKDLVKILMEKLDQIIVSVFSVDRTSLWIACSIDRSWSWREELVACGEWLSSNAGSDRRATRSDSTDSTSVDWDRRTCRWIHVEAFDRRETLAEGRLESKQIIEEERIPYSLALAIPRGMSSMRSTSESDSCSSRRWTYRRWTTDADQQRNETQVWRTDSNDSSKEMTRVSTHKFLLEVLENETLVGHTFSCKQRTRLFLLASPSVLRWNHRQANDIRRNLQWSTQIYWKSTRKVSKQSRIRQWSGGVECITLGVWFPTWSSRFHDFIVQHHRYTITNTSFVNDHHQSEQFSTPVSIGAQSHDESDASADERRIPSTGPDSSLIETNHRIETATFTDIEQTVARSRTWIRIAPDEYSTIGHGRYPQRWSVRIQRWMSTQTSKKKDFRSQLLTRTSSASS